MKSNCTGRHREVARAGGFPKRAHHEWRELNVLDDLDYAVELGVMTLPSIVIDGELVFTSTPTVVQLLILSNRLDALPVARDISRRSYSKMVENVALAFLFNGIGIPAVVGRAKAIKIKSRWRVMCVSPTFRLETRTGRPLAPIYWAGLQSFFSGVAGASLRSCGPLRIMLVQ
jgi:hypothetical protein